MASPSVPAVDAVPRPRRVRRRRAGAARARRRRRGHRRRQVSRSRGRHHQPAGEHDRLGPRDRRADRPGPRLAGPAHGRRVHHRQGRARPRAGAEPVGHQARLAARPRRGRTRPRPLLRHRRHLAGVVAVRRCSCTSPTTPTPPSPACSRPTGRRGTSRVLGASASRRSCCQISSTPVGVIGAATALPGAPPIAALVGDQQARWSARAASRPDGPRSRSAPAACSTCAAGPRRRRRPAAASTARSRSSPGHASGALTWGVEAIMLSAGYQHRVAARRPRPHRHQRREPRRRGVGRRQRRRGLRAGAARARHAAVGLRRPRHAARHHPRHRPGPTSCGPCWKASPTAAPTSSRPPRPTPGSTIATLRVDGGMSANPTFVQALADATGRPVEVSPVVEATTLGAAFLAGLATGVWGDIGDADRAWRPARVVEPGDAARPGGLGAGGRAGRRLDPRAVGARLLIGHRRVARPCPGREG